MEYKRDSDKRLFVSIWNRIKRVWVDLAILITMVGLTFLLPKSAYEASEAGSQLNLLALFITKTNSVVIPLLMIDIIRRWKWPYMDLQLLIRGSNIDGQEIKNAPFAIIFLAVIYLVFVYAFATGG